MSSVSTLTLPILMSNPAADLQSFIVFWSRLYAYNNAEQYQIIHKKELAQDDLIELYTWKNGMKLSAKKKESLSTNILGAVDEINRLRSSLTVDLDNFLIRFSKVSTCLLYTSPSPRDRG